MEKQLNTGLPDAPPTGHLRISAVEKRKGVNKVGPRRYRLGCPPIFLEAPYVRSKHRWITLSGAGNVNCRTRKAARLVPRDAQLHWAPYRQEFRLGCLPRKPRFPRIGA